MEMIPTERGSSLDVSAYQQYETSRIEALSEVWRFQSQSMRAQGCSGCFSEINLRVAVLQTVTSLRSFVAKLRAKEAIEWQMKNSGVGPV